MYKRHVCTSLILHGYETCRLYIMGSRIMGKYLIFFNKKVEYFDGVSCNLAEDIVGGRWVS